MSRFEELLDAYADMAMEYRECLKSAEVAQSGHALALEAMMSARAAVLAEYERVREACALPSPGEGR